MTYFEIGNQYFDNKDFDKAIDNYLKELNYTPDNLEILIKLSLAYYEIKNYELSIKVSDQILKMEPLNVHALINRGNCYQDSNRFKEAEKDFTKLIDLNPNVDFYYLNRANARKSLSDLKGAQEDLNKYRFLSTNNTDPIFSTDAIDQILELDLDAFNNSRKRFIDLISKHPNNYSAYFDLGVAYSKILAHTSAIDSYTKAMELYPGKLYDKALFNRANAYYDNGQEEEALKDIELYFKNISVDPYLQEIKSKILKN